MSQQINLYQPAFRRQEKRFSSGRLPLALGTVVLACAAFYGYAAMKTRELEGLARHAAAGVETQRRQVADLAAKFPSQGPSKVLQAEVARLEAELQKRQQLASALSTGELGNRDGFSAFLAAFGRRDIPGVWLIGVTIGDAGASLQVEGRALRAELVPAYLKSLGAEPMMQGRRVAELKVAAKSVAPQKGTGKAGSQGPERFVEFALSAPLSGAAATGPGGAGR